MRRLLIAHPAEDPVVQWIGHTLSKHPLLAKHLSGIAGSNPAGVVCSDMLCFAVGARNAPRNAKVFFKRVESHNAFPFSRIDGVAQRKHRGPLVPFQRRWKTISLGQLSLMRFQRSRQQVGHEGMGLMMCCRDL